jgi:hypothetical protein
MSAAISLSGVKSEDDLLDPRLPCFFCGEPTAGREPDHVGSMAVWRGLYDIEDSPPYGSIYYDFHVACLKASAGKHVNVKL